MNSNHILPFTITESKSTVSACLSTGKLEQVKHYECEIKEVGGASRGVSSYWRVQNTCKIFKIKS